MSENLLWWAELRVHVALDPLTEAQSRRAVELFARLILEHRPLAYTRHDLREMLEQWLLLHREAGEPIGWPLYLLLKSFLAVAGDGASPQ
jgi:hypothetical protein